MKVWYTRQDSTGVHLLVDPYSSPRGKARFSGIIMIVARVELGDDNFSKAEVSWASSTAETPERAALMSAGLRKAAQIAKQLDKGLRPKFPVG